MADRFKFIGPNSDIDMEAIENVNSNRSALRGWTDPVSRDVGNLGFRVLLSVGARTRNP
jgi:hypothetical protein